MVAKTGCDKSSIATVFLRLQNCSGPEESFQIAMKRQAPFFSVVLTTMDRPVLLRSAIGSLLGQSWKSFEAIVIDDGAMPAYMPDVLSDPRVIYVNKKNQQPGVAASRNLGMSLARGQYLCFLDDDDLLNSDYLSWLNQACESYPGRALFGNFDRVDEELSGTRRVERSRTPNRIADWDVNRLLVCNFIPICAITFPMASGLPRFDETLPSHEDWDFLLGCLSRFEFVGVDRTACEVRQRVTQPVEHRHASRKQYFGFDFLAIYQRHPRRELAQARAAMLQSLGLQLPVSVLENIGRD